MPSGGFFFAAAVLLISFGVLSQAAPGEWTYWTPSGAARYQGISWTDATNGRVYIYGGTMSF
jgi:hypothetical protein